MDQIGIWLYINYTGVLVFYTKPYAAGAGRLCAFFRRNDSFFTAEGGDLRNRRGDAQVPEKIDL